MGCDWQLDWLSFISNTFIYSNSSSNETGWALFIVHKSTTALGHYRGLEARTSSLGGSLISGLTVLTVHMSLFASQVHRNFSALKLRPWSMNEASMLRCNIEERSYISRLAPHHVHQPHEVSQRKKITDTTAKCLSTKERSVGCWVFHSFIM